MTFLHQMNCCGIKELAMLQDSRSFPAMLDRLGDPGCGAIIFTQAGTRSKYGARFAEFVRHNNLGQVVEAEAYINPNTGRSIKAFIWVINKSTHSHYLRQLRRKNGSRNVWEPQMPTRFNRW